MTEPLAMATVSVKGFPIGTISDYSGDFILSLREGNYTLQISYMGYETVEREISVAEGRDLELNVDLAPVTIMGEEAVITAQARGQLAAVNQQLRSNQIVNVVSRERIKELPDENAAQAISRLPGVHLDGSKVVVRGIQPKMNKIMINGVAIPSTEANDRASDLGFISSNQLSGIQVFKTLTPDMDADAIGGVVNLMLQEAREGSHASITCQGAYNQQEKALGSAKIWIDFSDRYLDNRFGLSLNLNYEKYQGGVDRIVPGYEKLGGGDLGDATYMFANVTVQDISTISDNYGGNLVFDYKFPRGKLVYTGMFAWNIAEHIDYIDKLGDSHSWICRSFKLFHDLTPTHLLNNSLRYEHQIGIVKMRASASAISVKRHQDFNYSYWYGYDQVAFNANELTQSVRLKMKPWEMYSYEIPNNWETIKLHKFHWMPQAYMEDQYLADMDFEVPVRFSDHITATLKMGMKYRKLARNFDETRSYYGGDITYDRIQVDMADFIQEAGQEQWQTALQFPFFRDYSYNANRDFMNGSKHWRMDYVPDLGDHKYMALELMDYSKLKETGEMYMNDYWGDEELLAGYVMTEIDLWNRLLIIPGVRYERVNNRYTGLKVEHGSLQVRIMDTITKPATHTHLLPHLHSRLKVTDWMDLRFSYNQTLSRPDYNFAIPGVYYNTSFLSGKAGNPYIKPTISRNLDANITLYSKRFGLFTLGGFMKTIEDVFYMQPSRIENIPDTTIRDEFPLDVYPALASGQTEFYINNPYPAYLRGIETEWQSNFTWLPSPFNGIVVNVNYTHVWSETTYIQHRLIEEYIPTPPFVKQVESDTFYVNRLLHQANDIANVSLGYDHKGFSARLSFRFQGNVISGIASRPEENVYTNNVYKFDFAAKQRIHIKNLKLEVFLNAINFTNVPYRRYSIYPNKGETNLYTEYTGRQFQLGIRLMI